MNKFVLIFCIILVSDFFDVQHKRAVIAHTKENVIEYDVSNIQDIEVSFLLFFICIQDGFIMYNKTTKNTKEITDEYIAIDIGFLVSIILYIISI